MCVCVHMHVFRQSVENTKSAPVASFVLQMERAGLNLVIYMLIIFSRLCCTIKWDITSRKLVFTTIHREPVSVFKAAEDDLLVSLI